MKKPAFLAITLAAAAAFAGSAEARGIGFDKPIEARAVITKSSSGTKTKTVTLMNMHLTAEQKKRLMTFSKTTSLPGSSLAANRLPSHVDLGMNGVPVLDQGHHGSCVTFATTAAVDAVLGAGDYVSQLCNLELGSTLSQVGYTPSGWDGSWGPLIIEQILNFGIVNKEKQVSKSCAGLTEYPMDDDEEVKAISFEDFRSMSEDLSEQLSWYSLLSNSESSKWTRDNDKESGKLLDKVRQTLSTRNNNNDDVRLTFGIALPVNHCFVGACGTYRAPYDTWTLTEGIKYDSQPMIGGHEMVITGYDDNAVVTDNEGKKHTGLLIVRNSWGDDVGDAGNFYISYDFFKQYIWEVQAIVTTHNPIE